MITTKNKIKITPSKKQTNKQNPKTNKKSLKFYTSKPKPISTGWVSHCLCLKKKREKRWLNQVATSNAALQ